MTLRSLSAAFVVCAAVFGILAARQDYPEWARMTDRVALEWRDKALAKFAELRREAFPDSKPSPWAGKEPAPASKPIPPLPSDRRLQDPEPVEIAPHPLEPEVAELPYDLPPGPPLPDIRIADAPEPVARTAKPLVAEKHVSEIARPPLPAELPPPPPRVSIAPNPAQIARVRERLADSLTTELAENFELFLYVSKAETGPWAQHMYVFQRRKGEEPKPLYVFPVSTGREKVEYNRRGERLPSYTPAGYYQLDPKRSYRKYRSVQWDRNMPHAMFFTWIKDGAETGLAIHGAEGADIGQLGKRASAGCVRLAPENAELLYNLIRKRYRGPTPRFAFDKRTRTMSNEGMLKRDREGRLEFGDGYKVLVFIENHGGQDVVAALF